MASYCSSEQTRPATPVEPLPRWVCWAWAGACISWIIAVPVPGIGLSSTTVLSLPVIWFAYTRLNRINDLGLIGFLVFIAWFTTLAGVLSGHLGSIYLNFFFWLISSYASFRMMATPQGRDIALRALGWTIIILILLRFADIIFGTSMPPFFRTNRNGYAFFFSIFLVCGYVVLEHRTSKMRANLFLLLSGGVLALNGSRSGMLSGAIAAVLVKLYFVGGIQRRTKALIFLLVATASVAALAPTLANYSEEFARRLAWFDRLLETQSSREFYEGGGATVKLRHILAKKAFELFEAKPLSGVGLMRYAEERQVRSQWFLDAIGTPRLQAHNSYLSWLAETGLVGTVPFAIFVGWLLWRARRSRRLYLRTEDPAIVALTCVALIAILELNFVGNYVASGTWSMLCAFIGTQHGSRDRLHHQTT